MKGSWLGFLVVSCNGETIYHQAAKPPPLLGAIPEPSTWVLLIIGFGLVGVFLRHTPGRKG